MNLQDFMSGMRENFADSSQNIFIILIVLAAAVFIWIVILIIRKLAENARLSKLHEKKYLDSLRRFTITDEEKRFMDSLAAFLKNPEKKYLLFENQHLFNFCLYNLKRSTTVPREPLGTLLSKLQFKLTDSFHQPVSSRELPVGKPVLLVTEEMKKIPALVEEILPASLVVSVDAQTVIPAVGSDLSVYTYNERGLITFTTTIQNLHGNIISIAHSEHLQAIQRRENFRKQIVVPIYIRREGPGMPALRSEIIDLSAGGMSIKNPGLSFTRGDDCLISFAPDAGIGLDLYGEVVRVSKGGNILHIRFGHFPEAMEDQIVRFLNKKRE